jgi:hypothetical protein
VLTDVSGNKGTTDHLANCQIDSCHLAPLILAPRGLRRSRVLPPVSPHTGTLALDGLLLGGSSAARLEKRASIARRLTLPQAVLECEFTRH